MKAVVVRTFGGPEVLEVVDLPEPHAGAGEVRIRVHAAAVNPADVALRTGADGQRPQPGSFLIPGMDAAGEIDEIGEDVAWRVGDAVMAITLPFSPLGGAYAAHVVVPTDSVARIPSGADFVHASTLPMNGLTARMSLDQLALQRGQTIAVTGAAGAYGGYVVQLAKADGLCVIADALESDAELVSSLGADVVVVRGDEVSEGIRRHAPGGVDGLADGAVQNELVLAAIKDGGALATVRGWGGPAERGISIHRTRVADYAREHAKLDLLRQQVEDGVVTLRVAATHPPDEAPEAHRRLQAGGTRGRLVIQF